MSSQWFILLIFIAFVQLAVTNVMYSDFDDEDHKQNPIEPVDLPSHTNVEAGDIDTDYYYRLTDSYSGEKLALDVINDGQNYGLNMAPVADYTGQYWYFVHVRDNVYSLRTRFLGDAYSLDIINDGINNNKPHMAKTGHHTGQYWHLTRLIDGTYNLSNEFTGLNMALDISRNSHIVHMSAKKTDYSGQQWQLTKIGRIDSY
ncbi:unnamed protein product [Adineta steineri]|uniref:Ricin B lectin domain-containing protein n=1 Tax=Adineta steineri TaxID=433720 RepID=A0A815MNV9_9BILA|nr:unnamed protein product [Adineta steineri]CAF1427314.1 unnamed protein product [Adineta steineri]